MPRRIEAWHDHVRFVCDVCDRSYEAHEAASRCEENHRTLAEAYPSSESATPTQTAIAETLLDHEERLEALEKSSLDFQRGLFAVVSASNGCVSVDRLHFEDSPFMTLVRENDFINDRVIYRLVKKR